MRASAWRGGGSKSYGIRVGKSNRKEHFEEGWKEITVEMGGEVRAFPLTAGFWSECPEFRDRGRPAGVPQPLDDAQYGRGDYDFSGNCVSVAFGVPSGGCWTR